MKRVQITGILLLFTAYLVTGQNDPKALSVLDKFSAKASAAPSVSMKFILVSNDQVKNSVDTISGSVLLKKNSYKLELPDNIIWYNGETSWSYLPAEQEVTITTPDKKDNSFQSRPSMIFTMYREGYKCRLLEEKSDSYLIDLYPADTKNEIVRVRLSIKKLLLELSSFEYKRKDGITLTLYVKEYSDARIPEQGFFDFPLAKFKGVEVIDMR